MQPLVACGPLVAHQLAHGRVVEPHGEPHEEPRDQRSLQLPHPVGQLVRERRLGQVTEVEDGPRRVVVLQYVAAHVIPVGLEVLPGLGDRPRAHAVQGIPRLVLLEQLPLLRLGEPAAEAFGDDQRADEERRVRPVEDVRVQCVIAPPLGVDALDVDVIVADLGTGARRPVAIEDHAADRVQRPQQTLPALDEERGVLLDGSAELGVHVLHRAGPRPLQQAPPVAEVLPRQRVGSERCRRGVIAARGDGATDGEVGCAGDRARRGRILCHWRHLLELRRTL